MKTYKVDCTLTKMLTVDITASDKADALEQLSEMDSYDPRFIEIDFRWTVDNIEESRQGTQPSSMKTLWTLTEDDLREEIAAREPDYPDSTRLTDAEIQNIVDEAGELVYAVDKSYARWVRDQVATIRQVRFEKMTNAEIKAERRAYQLAINKTGVTK